MTQEVKYVLSVIGYVRHHHQENPDMGWGSLSMQTYRAFANAGVLGTSREMSEIRIIVRYVMTGEIVPCGAVHSLED